MFDLMELDQAETALRALAGGTLPPPAPREAASPDRRGDIARCPFHNGTLDQNRTLHA